MITGIRTSWLTIVIFTACVLPSAAQEPLNIESFFEDTDSGLEVRKMMNLSVEGELGCQALQITSDTSYLVWKITPSIVMTKGIPATCSSPEEAVT